MFQTTSDRLIVDQLGRITSSKVVASETWKVTGAVEYGRGFTAGRVVRYYTLHDILAGAVPWFYRNGKQRCFVRDIDHGTHRVQMSPPLLSVTIGR